MKKQQPSRDPVEVTVRDTVLEIIRDRFPKLSELSDEQSLSDLFDSLDMAQLVATLEIKLGVDPFATHVAIANVRTVADLYRIYRDVLSPLNSKRAV